jgi:xylose isomerase
MRNSNSQFFPNVGAVAFEGPHSTNPLAFKQYDADEKIEGKTMRQHLRFAVCYWHTMRNTLSDPFGHGTALRPWDNGSSSVDNAQRRVHAAFEFIEKLGAPFYCFHDRDVAPEGHNLAETNRNLDAIVAVLKQEQKRTGIKLLWGTANLFSHPRYVHGAATSCNVEVFAFAAAQVKKAMEVTHELGGAGYVFWGGREGYSTLLNTDMKREREHLARFLHCAVDYKKELGFKGQLYIEPKPREPTKHQYDSDAAACLNFLREFDLLGDFKLNLETNHATLAGHTMSHELQVAAAAGKLGSIDANVGDELLGWDTDQFPTNLYLTTQVMLAVLEMGGLRTGGLNFDAKVRRESFEPEDLFHAHIGAMDAFALGLKIAASIRQDGRLAEFAQNRYATWDSYLGRQIEKGKLGFADLETYMLQKGEARPNTSGRQEMLENIFNECLSRQLLNAAWRRNGSRDGVRGGVLHAAEP